MATKGVPTDDSLDQDEPLGIEGADADADGDGTEGQDAQDAQDGQDAQQGDKGDGKASGEIEIEFVDTDVKGEGDQGDKGDQGDEADSEQHDPGTGEDGGEAADDGDGKKYGRKVRERIAREMRVTARERQRAETAERGELEAVRKNAILSYALAEVTEKTLKGDIDKAKGELKQAKEKGDTDKEVELTAELSRLQGKLAEVERHKPELQARAKAAQEGKLFVPGRGQAKESTNPLTEAWKARNKWFSDPRFAADAKYAAAIDSELANEKHLSPNDPAYFTEWDRRIRERMPTLLARWRKANGGGGREGGKPGSGTITSGGQRSSTKSASQQRMAASGKVIITKADKEFMRSLGLDPDKKDDLQAFARERLETQRQGGK